MRRIVGTGLVVATLGLGGLVVAPGVASGAEGGRLGALQQALAGLVADGTLEQGQADKVAEAVEAARPERLPASERPHGGRFDRPALAEAVGTSVKELRTGLRSGGTLAQLAEARGLGKDELVARMVVAGEAQLAEDVAAGALTQAQADTRRAQLQQRVTARVDQVNRPGPPGEERAPRG